MERVFWEHHILERAILERDILGTPRKDFKKGQQDKFKCVLFGKGYMPSSTNLFLTSEPSLGQAIQQNELRLLSLIVDCQNYLVMYLPKTSSC